MTTLPAAAAAAVASAAGTPEDEEEDEVSGPETEGGETRENFSIKEYSKILMHVLN